MAPDPARFSYATNIGVAGHRAGASWLEISNPSLKPGLEIRLVNPSPPPATSGATIVRLAPECPDEAAEATVHCYVIQQKQPEIRLPAIALIGYDGPFTIGAGTISADLDRDGHPHIFRSCASSEGVHFTIWNGKYLQGKPDWSQYYYLGYDVEATCKPAEENPR